MADGTWPFGESGNSKSSYTYECVCCGKPTTRRKKLSGTRARIYCSAECRAKGRARPADRECVQCGVTFSLVRPDGRLDRASRKYCSQECYLAPKRNQVTKTCPVCGNDFTFPASAAAAHRVCSVACKTADTIYRNCERCGKRFRCDKREDHNSRFCSEECRRPPVMANCLTCGNEFRKVPGRDENRFCSAACWRLYRGETMLEARIRVALELLGIDFQQEYPAGRLLIDFALVGNHIALEADGGYWHEIQAERDAKRDERLKRAGWRVIRLAEADVNATADTGRFILDRIREATGLELADLPKSSGITAVRPGFRRTRRRQPLSPAKKRRPGPGQAPLWS